MASSAWPSTGSFRIFLAASAERAPCRGAPPARTFGTSDASSGAPPLGRPSAPTSIIPSGASAPSSAPSAPATPPWYRPQLASSPYPHTTASA
eukprot:6791679-Prymnesium_polylepis.1